MNKSLHSAPSYLAWAKAKGSEAPLSHSSIEVPLLGEVVNQAYCSGEFATLLREDNQWGHAKLKSAIARRYKVDDAKDLPRVLLTPGASSAIYLVCKTFLAAGDEVIIEAPTYEPFVAAAQDAGAKVVWWRRKAPDFSLDLDYLLDGKLIAEKTRLIVISNPHNPSSNLALDSELQQLAQAVRASGRGDVKIVVDEIYRDLLRDEGDNFHAVSALTAGYGAESAAALGGEFISINSLSKVYGLSRLRTGWILGTPEVIQRLRRTYETIINIGSLDTEAVSAIIFSRLDEHLPAARAVVRENREVLRDLLTSWFDDGVLSGVIPEHGCICFPKLGERLAHVRRSGVRSAIAILEEKCGIVPGVYFGSEYRDHFRLGLGGNAASFRIAAHALTATLERLTNGALT